MGKSSVVAQVLPGTNIGPLSGSSYFRGRAGVGGLRCTLISKLKFCLTWHSFRRVINKNQSPKSLCTKTMSGTKFPTGQNKYMAFRELSWQGKGERFLQKLHAEQNHNPVWLCLVRGFLPLSPSVITNKVILVSWSVWAQFLYHL